MGGVRPFLVEHQRRVDRDLDAPLGGRRVAQGEPAQLAVEVGPDAGLEPRLDPVLRSLDRDGGLRGVRGVALGVRKARRLGADAPRRAGVDVAQIDDEAVGVLGAVALPAGEQRVPQRREAAAGTAQHDV